MSKTIRKIIPRNAQQARETLAHPIHDASQGYRERMVRHARQTVAGARQIPRRTCMNADVDCAGTFKLNRQGDTNSRKKVNGHTKRQARIAGRTQIRCALQEA